MNLPNLITIARIVLAVVIIPLLFVDDLATRLLAFVVFLVAAFSDLWDGHLARSRGLITDLGKLLTPLPTSLGRGHLHPILHPLPPAGAWRGVSMVRRRVPALDHAPDLRT